MQALPPQPPPIAPPTQPVWVFTPPPPRWPTVVGIISTILGVASVASVGISIAMWIAFRRGAFRVPTSSQQSMNLFTGPNAWIEVVTFASNAITSLLLLIAGLTTVQRRAVGRPLHLWYAGLYLATLAFSMFTTIAGTNPAVARMGTPVGARSFMMLSMALGVVIAASYPTFLLIWFGPMKRRPASGAAGAPAPGLVAIGGAWMPERPRA